MFLTPNITIRKTASKGRGVFATKEIPGGAVIGDYIGIVTKSDEGEAGRDGGAFYDMWYSDKADICPQPDAAGAHLLNHSCEPNCAMATVERHTIIFALRKIFPGEELTYDYFLGDQDEDCKPGSDNCHCGSEFCRGTMYSNPVAYSRWEAYLEEKIGNAPEDPPVPYGAVLPPRDSYPKSIPDDLFFPLFGSRKAAPYECPARLLSDLPSLRRLIRKTGRQLLFPSLKLIVEGILYGGHIVLRPFDHRPPL